MGEKLVILGAGGHGRALIELLRDLGGLDVAGLVDAAPKAPAMLGVPVLGDESVLPGLRRAGVGLACIAIGEAGARLAAAARLAVMGFGFPPLVHPSAVWARSAELGGGERGAAACRAGRRRPGRAVLHREHRRDPGA